MKNKKFIVPVVILVLLAIAGIVFLRSKNIVQEFEKPVLRIGYLPITHAALPLIIYAQSGGKLEHFDLEMVKFSNWAELAEAIQSKQIDGGGDILNNLAFKITSKGMPLQAILMAVRDGSVLIVKNDIKDASQLKGKTIAIPSRFSPHYILIHEYLIEHGLNPDKDVNFLEMAPPDMVQALAAGGIDGYIVAEPFGSQAEELGIGRVLVLSRDMEIPGAKSAECSIAVRKDFIDRYPDAIQEFVEKLIQAGIWVDTYPEDAAKLLGPILGQKPSTIIHAMVEPPGRSGYVDLYPREKEFQALQDYMFSLGLLDKEIDMNEFVEERFADQAYKKMGLMKQD